MHEIFNQLLTHVKIIYGNIFNVNFQDCSLLSKNLQNYSEMENGFFEHQL